MWREPMVVIGVVVIATAVVVGTIAVFAEQADPSTITLLLAFVGGALLHLKGVADSKEAKTAAKTAVVVAEDTRAETVRGNDQVAQAVQTLSETVVTKNEVSEAAASGVRQGLEQARADAKQS